MRARFRTLDWGILTVIAVAVVLRLPYLTERSLWYDEASSWQTARFGWPGMLESLRQNVHLPLYYVLLSGWMAVWGESVASLRGFSVTLGVLTVIAMDRFARELLLASAAGGNDVGGAAPDAGECRRFGLWLAALVALAPFQVLASIEARMYSLGTALSAASAGLLLRIVREGRTTRLWGAYALVCLLLLYVHHYALFTIAAQVAFGGLWLVWLVGLGQGAEARRFASRAVPWGVAVGLAYLPGLALLRVQTGRVQQHYWIHASTWRTFSGTFSEFLIPTHGFDFLVGGWVVFGILAASCAVVAVGARRGDALVLALAVLPMVFAAAVSTVQPIWVARYFRFAHLFWLSALAIAVWKLTRGLRALRMAIVALIVATLLAANVAFWMYLDIPGGSGPRGAVEAILTREGPGATIVALDKHQYFPLKYYARGRAKVRLLQPQPDLFWGSHLIRDRDVLPLDRLGAELDRGIWTVGQMTDLLPIPELAGAKPAETIEIRFYMSLHRQLFVHHFAPRSKISPRQGQESP